MVVTYNINRPVGERVVAVTIGGEVLDPEATYTVTTLDFLASGADLYTGFIGAEVLQSGGPEFAELLEARFAGGEPVTAPIDERLVPVD